jgi:diacylglycerol O-acyltransferase / wax synthase
MEQLGGLDGAFVLAETPTMHLHVSAVLLLDTSTMPGGYSFERLRAFVHERMPAVPAVHMKLAMVPFNLSRPFWVEDPDLDIDRHLHHVALPAPGDDETLTDVISDIVSRPLERDHPLWEMWIVEGLADGRVAVVVKMHHATIDGVTGANLMAGLFDLKPTATPQVGTPVAQRSESAAVEAVSQIELLGRGLLTRMVQPWELAKLVPRTAMRVVSTLWWLGHGAGHHGGPGAAAPFTAPRTSFNTSITPRRSVAFVDVPLADVKRVREAFGSTVNDVVTAVVGGMLRSYLDRRGELPERSLIAATPVSVHADTARSAGMTKVSVMFSTLATDVEDPVERLEVVTAANHRAKEIHKMVGADTLMRWAALFWPNAFALGARLYSSLHVAEHHPVVHNLILSNVPGPPVPLYFAGARLVGLYPLGPITDGAGLNITVLSEEDRVGFGFITCPELVPRVWDLADLVPRALQDLVDAIPATRRASSSSRRAPVA